MFKNIKCHLEQAQRSEESHILMLDLKILHSTPKAWDSVINDKTLQRHQISSSILCG